ncbi:MAG TPA: bifunctional hydroxymethylpyrimidine kinase/phosphomethylpyrimidine kinase [Methanotrichaceae archaeon]|nr:bifunctional hydroxymethylpyrimidine kinase/phosphomethylpyrimidine kinase [Methanotrichaceae archaeon]
MPRVVLTIGGSDSGGGAGIQADIKTFSALGLHGTSVITAATAQNTLGMQKAFGLDPEAVAMQLRSVLSDFNVACAKTGMLFSAEIVSVVAEIIDESKVPLVVDPVIEAEAGGRLFRPEAVEALKNELIPIARVITPNIFEARALTGIEVSDMESANLAAQRLAEMGAEAVVVKGGHLDCTDLVLDRGDLHILKGQRAKGGNHGVGCTYSAALTAFLAEGCSLKDAASRSKVFAAEAVSRSMDVGHGVGPVDQAGAIREDAYRFRAISQVESAARMMMDDPGMRLLMPDNGIDLGMAIPGAISPDDIASCLVGGLPGCARFGRDCGAARVILAAMKLDPEMRAAARLSLKSCDDLGLSCSGIAQAEGGEMLNALSGLGDVVWVDEGGEPAAWLIARTASKAALMAMKISKLAGNGKI